MRKPKLTVIEGNKDADKVVFEGENWLAKEPQGSVFLYRLYGSKRCILNIRQLHKHFEKTCLLIANVNEHTDAPPVMEYVDTKLFSNLYEKVETIFVMPTYDAEKELELQKEHEYDGNPVRPDPVE